MIENIDLINLITKLKQQYAVEVSDEGHSIELTFSPSKETLSLKTPVYQGYNFIPYSVRDCLVESKPHLKSALPTYLYINEDAYSISLHYRGGRQDLDQDRFAHLLEEFGRIASQWRRILDDYDQRDLIHVKVP